jgi:NitT/TauT family transport system substrate-binding protein
VAYDLIGASFISGTDDYCTMFEPAASEMQAAGQGYIVASVGAASGNMPYTCFSAKKDYIEKNSKKVENFMRAILKGIDFVTNSSDEEVADAIAASFPTTKRELIVSSVKSYKAIDAYMTDPRMTETSFNTLIDLLKFAKSIDADAVVKYDEIIDTSIIEKILAE